MKKIFFIASFLFCAASISAQIPVVSGVLQKVKTYPVTIADNGPSGGTSEVDILASTIGANEFADGDEIEFKWTSSTINNTGSSVNYAHQYVYWNGNSTEICQSGISPSASEGVTERRLSIKRIGSDVYIYQAFSPSQTITNNIYGQTFVTNQFSGGGILTSQTFSSSAVLKVSIKFDVSDANLWYKVLTARCEKHSK